MVQKEKEIKANTKFLKQEVHLHRETDVSAFFVLVGVQYTCDVPEVRTDSVSSCIVYEPGKKICRLF